MMNSSIPSIDTALLVRVTGGAGADPAVWEKFKKQAAGAPMFGDKIKAIIDAENGGAPPESPEAAKALGQKVLAVIPESFRGMAQKQMASGLNELFPGQKAA